MRINVRQLPEVTKRRLRKAIETESSDIFILSHSKRSWATAGIGAVLLWIVLVAVLSYDFRWTSAEKHWILAVSLGAFLAGASGTSYWIKWMRFEFKDFTLINPLYLLRFRFDTLSTHVLLQAKAFKIHQSFGSETALHTTFKFVFDDGVESLEVKDIEAAKKLAANLERFAEQVPKWFQLNDSAALYSADLLYEFRQQEKEFSEAGPPAKPQHLQRIVGPACVLLLGAMSGLAFFYSADELNDYIDDEKRWASATSASTASSLRLYKAQRPDGRHVADANGRLNKLYQKAMMDYRNAAGLEASPGIEAVIKMLEYARKTERYKVAISFKGTNDIPNDIEGYLRSHFGVSRIIPIHPYFTPQINQAREAQVVQRISSAFRQVIPADILEYTTSTASDTDIAFYVSYTIDASGSMYYAASEEKLPLQRRNYYTGIRFGWNFQIIVPGEEEYPLEFSLASNPAEEIRVSYTKSRLVLPNELPPPQTVYEAMANSAFDDLTAKILGELSVQSPGE